MILMMALIMNMMTMMTMMMTMMTMMMIYRAIKLGLVLIEGCRGESLATALALDTLLVIWLPRINMINDRHKHDRNINTTNIH